MGNSSGGASGKKHLRVKIDSDVVEALRLQKLTSRSPVLAVENLLDTITERTHKVLSE